MAAADWHLAIALGSVHAGSSWAGNYRALKTDTVHLRITGMSHIKTVALGAASGQSWRS
jgi:hypothetical protein